MMHHEDVVVTIVDSNKKPIRELEIDKLNNGRKCKVILPFDSEYKFLIKNNCDTRIKLDIDIDGTNITNDGFIVNAYQNYYLERFLNSSEKFRFVRKNNEKVSDPTNSENGIIKVLVSKEIKPQTKYTFAPYYNQINSNIFIGGYPYIGTANQDLYSSNLCPPIFVNECDYSNIQCRSCESISEAGATVGGSHSNQQFATTEWNGDHGIESTFIFVLRGLDDSKNKKLEQYLKLKKELGL
jgi:hypothetical protein